MDMKCIALDLDGTTLLDDNSISPRTRAALEAAIARGVHVVVASGRCLDSLPRSVIEIPGIEYAITSNGAAVYRMENRECLGRFPVPAQALEMVLERARPQSTVYEVFCDGRAYASSAFVADPTAYGVNPASARYIQATRNGVEDVERFILGNRDAIDAVDLIVPDPKAYGALWEELEASIPGIYITTSGESRIEIASKEAGKDRGLAHLLGALGIDRAHTAAFGNADNDIEMLSYVRLGFAVENASPRCREASTHVVPAHTDDGVAFGIERLLAGTFS